MTTSTLSAEKTAKPDYRPDARDLAILRVLQRNARATIGEIAREVHLSTTPTYDRIRRMEQHGLIRQYAALVDRSRVNRGLMVICYVSLKEHNKKAGTKFIQSIMAMPDVVECYSISGEFDFMLKVLAENMEQYYDFHVNRLSQADNVGHIQSVFVMGTVKETLVNV
jgi:Lrp/AsnC family leucine-responsive transcriptional regulator